MTNSLDHSDTAKSRLLQKNRKTGAISARRKQEALTGFLLALPAMILFIGFLGYPLINSFYLSLTKYNFVYSDTPQWNGFSNYLQMASDPQFRVALLHTFQFTLMFLPSLIILGLGIASLIHSRAFGGNFMQGMIFLPVVIPLSIAGVMFIWMYSDNFGLVNFVLQNIGLGYLTRGWLSSPETVLPAITVVSLWKYTGLAVVLFLAGIIAIPSELFEAARIDGANSFQLLFYITIPNLKESFSLVTIWGLIESWKVFALPFVMTKGGPGDAAQVLYLYIYQTAFRYFDIGKASAMAFFLAFVILMLSVLTIRLSRNEIE